MASAQPVIELRNLSKAYRRKGGDVLAVDDVSLSVGAGEVYGFLGPNGAGKSTTIRMALGLIAPSSGEIFLFGENVAQRRSPLDRVGSLADGGSFYPHLTGRANLQVLARTRGLADAPINALLEQVELAGDANRKVKGYSLGMKQRLGVAAALLNDPALVILDEPTNGLDAAGIRDMRGLIRSLATAGKTVFLSSHLLHEVQQVCDRVAIIARGRLIQESGINDLLKGDDRVIVETQDPGRAVQLLAGRWRSDAGASQIELTANRAEIPEIIRILAAGGIDIYAVHPARQNLEEIFLDMTGGSDA